MIDRMRINEPMELFTFKLGTALTMEKKIVEMLGGLEEDAQSSELKQQLSRHRDETRQQVENVRRAFEALGEEPEDRPCLPIEAIEQQGNATLKLLADPLKDMHILAGVAETEHHEIAVYESLITQAEAMGHEDVAAMLRENLEQEERALRDGQRMFQEQATAAKVAR